MRGFAPDGVLSDQDALLRTLEGYSELLAPWASTVARYMLADVERRDARVWKEVGKEMSRAIRGEIAEAPTGLIYRSLMDEQVALIKSLPLEAAKRVQALTESAMLSSTRAAEVREEIMRTGQVTEARAMLIARTEVSRTAVSFTQARAMYAGSEGYIWRTSRDGDVRPTHREQEGRYIRWSSPPKTDKGLDPYHAGCGPNCRCYPEPVLPDL